MLPCTDSGIEIREWIKRLVGVQEKRSQTHCPAFGDEKGNILSTWMIKESESGVIPGDDNDKLIDLINHWRKIEAAKRR